MANAKQQPVPGAALRRCAMAAALAAILIIALVAIADLADLKATWTHFSVGPFVLAVLLSFLSLGARAWRLAILTTGASRVPSATWLRLAAAHQALFMVMPSGSGDFGYPILAARFTGTAVAPALRVLILYRLQDLLALALLAGAGLLLMSGDRSQSFVAVVAVTIAFAALLGTNDLARLAGKATARVVALVPAGYGTSTRWRDRLLGYVRVPDAAPPLAVRCLAAFSCLAAWCLATASLWVLFAMTGLQLDLAEIVLVIAGLNLVGALAAFSIAGLGISEGGLAAILVLIGLPLHAALSVALVVRPLAMIGSLVACGIAELVFRATGFTGAATNPTVEIGQDREQ